MRERRRRLPLAAVLASLAGLAFARGALADAVPPPPASCPPGQIGVTSHGGPACVLVAPTDCAPGWRGVQGGTCALAVCDAASPTCGAGERCAPVDLCVVEAVRTWGYGALRARRGPELAAPPHPLEVPQHDFSAVDVCGADASCTSGKCEALHVCLPAGRDRPPSAEHAGHVTSQAFVRSVSELDLHDPGAKGLPPASGGGDASAEGEPPPAPTSAADAGEGVAVRDVPRDAPRSGGCAGCAAATSSAPYAGAVAALLALAALVVRRKPR